MGIWAKLFEQTEMSIDQELNEIDDKIDELEERTIEATTTEELAQIDAEKEVCLARLKELRRRL